MRVPTPTQPRVKSAPFNLIRYFSLTSLILIILVGLITSVLSTQIATRNLVDQKQREAVDIARNLNYQIFNRILASHPRAQPNTPTVFASLQDVPELDAFIQERTIGLGVERVNIFDLNGKIVFSTDRSILGLGEKGHAGFTSARNGMAWSALEHNLEIRGFDGAVRMLDVVDVYAPIRSLFVNDTTDEIVGVFELYLSVGNEFAPQVAEAQQRAILATLGVMGLMFAGLLLIVVRADRVIRSSHQQLVTRESELYHLSEENARLYALTRSRRLDEQSTLLDYSRSLLQTLDPQDILDKAVHTMMELVPAACATIWVPDGASSHVKLVAQRGWPLAQTEQPFVESHTSLPATTIRRRQSIEMATLAGGRSFSIGEQLRAANFHSALGVPMLLSDRALGAFVIFRSEVQRFDSDEIRLLNLVANQTALALDQARLYQDTLERQRLAESLTRLGMVINATLNLQTVLDIVCSEAINHFNVSSAIIWQLHGNELVCVAAHGIGRDHFLGLRQPLDDPILVGARVIRERRPDFINHAEQSQQVKRALLALLQAKAIMGVPFFKGDQPLGAIVLADSVLADRFTEEDIVRARVFGQQAAIAIHNAQLYEQTQSQSTALASALTQLELTYDATLAALSAALDARDRETEGIHGA